jgi:hypothetical protein
MTQRCVSGRFLLPPVVPNMVDQGRHGFMRWMPGNRVAIHNRLTTQLEFQGSVSPFWGAANELAGLSADGRLEMTT